MNLLKNEIYLSNIEKGIDEIDEIMQLFKEKSILITGATGLIGSTVIDLLVVANQKYHLNVTVYALGRSLKKINERFSTKQAQQCIVPVLYEATKPFVFDHQVDYIIHAASNASPDLYTREPVETMQGNIFGISSLLEFAKNENVERILYVSSSEVYGEYRTEKPLMETDYGYIDILNSRSSYPMGKRAAETLCIGYLNEYQVQSIIVRPGHIYGPSAKRGDARVSSAFVYQALNGESIVMKSKGSQIRSYTYSIDCATALLFSLMKGKPGEAYNISNPNSIISIAEMARIISSLGQVPLEFDLPTGAESEKFNPMDNSSLDSEKLYNLGWKANFGAYEGFQYTMSILANDNQKLV